MALSLENLFKLTLLGTFICMATQLTKAQVEEPSLKLLMSDAFEWPTDTMSLLDEDTFGDEIEDGGELDFDGRRALFWRAMRHYYISYGALSANRIPCPPRSGRSYYTHNCFKARGPVHPYNRGCSRIARCRR